MSTEVYSVWHIRYWNRDVRIVSYV